MLNNIKKVLGLSDSTKDELLKQFIETAETRLKLKLGGLSEIPNELWYIVNEIVIMRYNRVSDEGTSSKSVDGVSSTYLDNDFSPYEDEIEAWKDNKYGRRKVRFL